MHGLEPEPLSLQVVVGGLVASGFQFPLDLAAVLAEEFDGFGLAGSDGQI